jgi:hypothetical protein
MANAGESAGRTGERELATLAERELAALAQRRSAAIRRTFVRLDRLALGCGVGAVAGLAVLIATLVAVEGGALASDPFVGENLRGLAAFFPGYRPDVAGAFIGGAWGFATGFVAGFATAGFRNLALALVFAWARATGERWRRKHLLDEI